MEPTNKELRLMLRQLKEQIVDGFEGVHKRQDQTNGNVIKNSEFRLKSQGVMSFLQYIGIANIAAFLYLIITKSF